MKKHKENPDQMTIDELMKPMENCIWYDRSPSGEDCCSHHKIPLARSLFCPCFFCDNFKEYKEGEPPWN